MNYLSDFGIFNNSQCFTMVVQYKVVYGLSNGAIFNDLERPIHPVSRSHYSLTLNISETVRDTDIVSMEY